VPRFGGLRSSYQQLSLHHTPEATTSSFEFC
jgi:hypothetical protein